MPGSKNVLDRATGKLVPCDATICPNAVDGINHAPFAAFGGWSGVVNSAADQKTQGCRLSTSSATCQHPEQSNQDVTVGVTGMNPYRLSQFDDEHRRQWIESRLQ